MPEDVVVLGTNEDLASRPRSVTLSFDCEQRHIRAIPSDVVENPHVTAVGLLLVLVMEESWMLWSWTRWLIMDIVVLVVW